MEELEERDDTVVAPGFGGEEEIIERKSFARKMTAAEIAKVNENEVNL